MKVILLRDVAKIGRRFEVVNVPDGFALNKLIPQRMAEIATPAGLKKVGALKEKTEQQKTNQLEELNDLKTKLEESKLLVKAEANEKGHLFKGVSVKEIVETAKEAGILIPEEFLVIKEPIKTLGEHKISLKTQKEEVLVTIEIISNK